MRPFQGPRSPLNNRIPSSLLLNTCARSSRLIKCQDLNVIFHGRYKFYHIALQSGPVHIIVHIVGSRRMASLYDKSEALNNLLWKSRIP